jgi:cation diffusion facilitator family transporter
VINLLLATLKITAGLFAQSQALVADGLHSFSDLTTDIAILVGAGYWSEPADASHPYGHGRLETLVNIVIGAILAVTGIGIGWRAVASMLSASTVETHPSWIVFCVAIIAVFSKESLYRWTLGAGKKYRSRALESNAWHHRSDALSSIPVAIAVLCGFLFPAFHYFDNIAALIVATMIAKVSWDIFIPSLKELLETNDDFKLIDRIKFLASEDDCIGEIHAVRARRVGKAILVDFHMLVDPGMSVKQAHGIAEKFKTRLLESEPDLTDAVIHIEPL